MKRFKENRYFHFGMMLLTVVCIGLAMLAVVLNLDKVLDAISFVMDVLSPVIIGVALAYLLNPLMKFLDRYLYPLLRKCRLQEARAKKVSKAASLVLALLIFCFLVYQFFALLLPQLYESIVGIINNFSDYYVNAEKWLQEFLADNPAVQKYAMDIVDSLYDTVGNLANSGLLTGLEDILKGLTSSVMDVLGGVMDTLIGLCVAVYILASKDRFMAQSKKLAVALLKDRTVDRVLELGRKINRVFSGFIIGKIVDSMIIGVLCYIGMLILNLPYPALIATVVGVTNVIPFFGPFIGAIPSGILILLVNPMQALYFGLFILALQQLDGNVIGPYILGDTVGISGFWVLVSITVAGGLFGFSGMLLGVPVFAVLYMLVKDFAESRLKRKNRTVETNDYLGIRQISDLDHRSAETESVCAGAQAEGTATDK